MKYSLVTNFQLALATLMIGVTGGVVFCLFYLFLDYRLLPEVHLDAESACVKVINFENGHAFNCNDVNVILRRYRTVTPS